MKKEKLSAEIERFLAVCDGYRAKYDAAVSMMETCDGKSSDFQHRIELERTTYRERAKLATAERQNRIERRKYKDITEQYATLSEALTNQNVIAAMKVLKEVLGKVRKVENYHETRKYRKKTPE